jgi:putative transposase
MTKHASESQIVKILDEVKNRSGNVEDICRKHGISRSTLYKWQNKYDGMSIQELKRLKKLESENSRLKSMYAELSLVNEALKDIIEKKL